MTIAEAAEYLGISPYTLRDKVTRGEVPHTRILGNRHGVRFTATHLAAIVAAGEQPVVRRLRSAPRTRL
jgi:excisionase family DNA binding protein